MRQGGTHPNHGCGRRLVCCIHTHQGMEGCVTIWLLLLPLLAADLQQHLFSGIGREMTPTFLGGDLDFDSTARQWWDKMDAAITERQANPKGHQVGPCTRGCGTGFEGGVNPGGRAAGRTQAVRVGWVLGGRAAGSTQQALGELLMHRAGRPACKTGI